MKKLICTVSSDPYPDAISNYEKDKFMNKTNLHHNVDTAKQLERGSLSNCSIKELEAELEILSKEIGVFARNYSQKIENELNIRRLEAAEKDKQRKIKMCADAIRESMSKYGINKYYTIKSGDTLTDISIKFCVSMFDLAKENGIKDFNKIYAGDILIIPSRKND